MFKKENMAGDVDFGGGGIIGAISFIGGHVAKKNTRSGFRYEFVMSNVT